MMFQLDEHPHIRDVSFVVLLNLIRTIKKYQPAHYKNIVECPFEDFLAVWTNADGIMARTRRYFHLNALKVLNLIIQNNKAYSLSPTGNRIIEASTDASPDELNEQTIKLFREAVLSSVYVQDNFLVLFVGRPYKDPLKWGVPVALNPLSGEKTYNLRSPLWSKDLLLTKLQTQGLIWGLKQWCQFLTIIDEIFIRPQNDVDENNVNIIFPVDIEKAKSISVIQFHVMLKSYLPIGRPVYKDTVSISIPLLLYKLCPGEHLPLDRAKELLLEWIKLNKEAAFIESSSFPVLHSGRFKRGSTNIPWRKQEDSFLFLEGKYFSRLFASESLWK